jgi:hypothetical protein
MINPHILDQISQDIYRQFPEMKGVNPKVRTQPGAKKNTSDAHGSSYLLSFETRTSLANGAKISRLVRVTVDTNGKILKISTSR